MLLGKAEKGTLLLAFPWVSDGKALADIWEELQTWADNAERSAGIRLKMRKLHNFSFSYFPPIFIIHLSKGVNFQEKLDLAKWGEDNNS